MTLESAERLVEKILQQLEVRYEVADEPTADDRGTQYDRQRTIVVAEEDMAQVPPELRPLVTPGSTGEGTGEGS
jgi:hypothetical protein